jgi:hypothetical protein
LKGDVTDEFKFLSPVSHTFVGFGEDVSQLVRSITVRNRDTGHSRLFM